jgi:hypothetical protein
MFSDTCINMVKALNVSKISCDATTEKNSPESSDFHYANYTFVDSF